MKVERITLREIRMPLLTTFETSFGATAERRILLVEVEGEGSTGWGEVTAGEQPFYNEESTDTAWYILREFAIPQVIAKPLASAAEAAERWKSLRGHRMATGGLEAALWDWEARLQARPLHALLGGTQRVIPCGVSIGIKPTIDELLATIATELAAGYQRIKIKIKPGWDIDVVEKVRERFPGIKLTADANSSYTLAGQAHLKLLDRFSLMMLEQPLAHDDIMDHARLQQSIQTPICLDESIRTLRHAEQAIESGACRIINIKLGRVGGFGAARAIHDCCSAAGIPVWCGGMLESGVGRAHNIALSTLPNFVLPGDVSASRRYWEQDVIQPEVVVTPRGTIEVPGGAGMGYEVDRARVERLTVRKELFP
jgi:O-succinylbenzoate synthase